MDVEYAENFATSILTSLVFLNKAIYEPGEYRAIRNIFDRILDLQNTMIVIKK